MKKKKDTHSLFILSIFVLFLTNILFNGWICAGSRVFYLDDLSCIESFLTKSVGEFIFSTGANKIRFISNSLIWIVLQLSQNNYEIIDEILLLMNFVNSVLIFSFMYSMQRNSEVIRRIILSLICGILFIASHFAYYNISEVLGMMEALGITLAISMLWTLDLYTESGKDKWFYSAAVLYALLIWTHERYFVLFFSLLIAVYINKDMKLKDRAVKTIIPLIILALFWGGRLYLFGNRAIDGTGGTSIGETFDIFDAVKYCFSQVMYILGFNWGPQYLNGIEAKQVPYYINILIVFNVVFVLCVSVAYIRLMIKNAEVRHKNLKRIILLLSFIILCIICSSVTIRVEMRWIYVSYAAYLILTVYMIVGLLDYYTLKIGNLIIFCLCFVSILITEQFYREHYSNIYYWRTKDMARELYNVTIETYGNGLIDRDIIILSDSSYFEKNEGWQSEDWKNFFKPYIDIDEIKVTYVNNINEIEQLTNIADERIVLLEDLENRKYIEITSDLLVDRSSPLLAVNNLYGIYEDWWCEPDCAFVVEGAVNNRASLTFYYPDDKEIIGTANGTIIINGEEEIAFDLTGNLTRIDFDLPPQKENTIRVVSNYWVYENTESSRDGRLSNVMTVNVYK